MKPVELENIEKVRHYVCEKLTEIFDGDYNIPNLQDISDIQMAYMSEDTDTHEFVDQGIFGWVSQDEETLIKSMDKMEIFCARLKESVSKYTQSPCIRELKKIAELVEEKIKSIK